MGQRNPLYVAMAAKSTAAIYTTIGRNLGSITKMSILQKPLYQLQLLVRPKIKDYKWYNANIKTNSEIHLAKNWFVLFL
jgi:hypothetical protein